MGAEFWSGLLAICFINLILSGDNAIIIAMASRNLPPKLKNKAIFIGTGFAIVLRIALTLVAAYLLTIPYLQFIGGLLLVAIGIKLLTDEEDDGDDIEASDSLATAIRTIVIADLIMSLDNVLAVAAVADGDYLLLILGLAISIPIIIGGSQLLVFVMNKFPFFVYIGAGLIAYAAGEMINQDKKIGPMIYNFSNEELAAKGLDPNTHQSVLNVSPSLEWLVPAFLIAFVCGVGYRVRSKRAAAKAEGDVNVSE